MTRNSQAVYFHGAGFKTLQMRRELGVSLTALAKAIGLSELYLAHFEMGYFEPPQETIEMIQSFIRRRPQPMRRYSA